MESLQARRSTFKQTNPIFLRDYISTETKQEQMGRRGSIAVHNLHAAYITFVLFIPRPLLVSGSSFLLPLSQEKFPTGNALSQTLWGRPNKKVVIIVIIVVPLPSN